MNESAFYLRILALDLWSGKKWFLGLTAIIFFFCALVITRLVSSNAVEANLYQLAPKWNVEFTVMNRVAANLAKNLGFVENKRLEEILVVDQIDIARKERDKQRVPVALRTDAPVQGVFDRRYFLIDNTRAFSMFLGSIRRQQRRNLAGKNTVKVSGHLDSRSAQEAAKRTETQSVKLITPKGTKMPNWKLRVVGRDVEHGKKMAIEIIHTANNDVKRDMKERISKLISQSKERISNALTSLQFERKNAILLYDTATLRQLTHLQEQANIARAAGIKSNSSELVPTGLDTAIVSTATAATPAYYRGYVALEKQIELIKDRQGKLPYVEGLEKIDESIRRLQNERSIEIAESEFNRWIVQADGFEAAEYEYPKLVKVSIIRKFVYILLALAGSVLIAGCTIIVIARIKYFMESETNAIG